MRTNAIDSKAEKPKRLLLDIPDACEVLDCSRAKFYDLVRRGDIKLVKLGRASRVRPADLEALVDRLASR
jgi:excisionase family DNA binding protein